MIGRVFHASGARVGRGVEVSLSEGAIVGWTVASAKVDPADPVTDVVAALVLPGVAAGEAPQPDKAAVNHNHPKKVNPIRLANKVVLFQSRFQPGSH